MKKCTKCGFNKPLEEFNRRGSNGHQAWCKLCVKTYDKSRYDANPTRYTATKATRRRELAAWVWDLKKDKPCTDCGVIFHPAAMQWDHISNDKAIDIANTAGSSWSRKRILEEISKCELVCANCHHIRTFYRREHLRDVAQFGSASGWGPEGQESESPHPD